MQQQRFKKGGSSTLSMQQDYCPVLHTLSFMLNNYNIQEP